MHRQTPSRDDERQVESPSTQSTTAFNRCAGSDWKHLPASVAAPQQRAENVAVLLLNGARDGRMERRRDEGAAAAAVALKVNHTVTWSHYHVIARSGQVGACRAMYHVIVT